MGIKETLVAQFAKAGSSARAAGNTAKQVAEGHPRKTAAAAAAAATPAVVAVIPDEETAPMDIEPVGGGKFRITLAMTSDADKKLASSLSQFVEPAESETGAMTFVVNRGVLERVGVKA